MSLSAAYTEELWKYLSLFFCLLQLNLKFEIEVLCKNLSLDINDLKPGNLLKDKEKLKSLEEQLSAPKKEAKPPEEMLPVSTAGGYYIFSLAALCCFLNLRFILILKSLSLFKLDMFVCLAFNVSSLPLMTSLYRTRMFKYTLGNLKTPVMSQPSRILGKKKQWPILLSVGQSLRKPFETSWPNGIYLSNYF